jgi:hypothetical protein
LFQLGDYPIGIASWGAGNIGARSVSGLILDYSETIKALPSTIEEAARGLYQYIVPLYNTAFASIEISQQPLLGFFIGGYSQEQPLPELWEVRLPGTQQESNQVIIVRGQEDFGANWRGIELPFTRLHFGVDPRVLEQLLQHGVDQTIIQEAFQKYQSPVIFDSMPIQDAINFSSYILRTTIAFTTFEIGIPSCGEPLQIALILRRKGFVWVEEPRFHV